MKFELNQVTEKPKYESDGCKNCVFLGEFNGEDLYFCMQNSPTVISRYGNEGFEYSSGLIFAEMGLLDPSISPNLTEGLRRAKKYGLVDIEIKTKPKQYIIKQLEESNDL